MADQTRHAVSHKELIELLIKRFNLHEGRWWLTLRFGFGAGNFGPSDNDMLPGAFVAVQEVGLTKVEPGMGAPPSLVVDAAEVNPAPKPRPRPRRRVTSKP